MAPEIKKYQFAADRKSRLLGRLMLLKYLRDGNSAFLIDNWKCDGNNKPYLDGWKHFNISHSGDIVVFCFSDGEVGIDIEKKASLDFSAFTSQFCLKEEDYILNSDNVMERFYEVWVKKEAVLKAEGVGIINGLNTINCLQNTVYFKGKTWYFTKLDLYSGYASSLCAAQPNIQIKIEPFNPRMLLI